MASKLEATIQSDYSTRRYAEWMDHATKRRNNKYHLYSHGTPVNQTVAVKVDSLQT